MIDAEDLKIKVKGRAHAYNLEPQDIMKCISLKDFCIEFQ